MVDVCGLGTHLDHCQCHSCPFPVSVDCTFTLPLSPELVCHVGNMSIYDHLRDQALLFVEFLLLLLVMVVVCVWFHVCQEPGLCWALCQEAQALSSTKPKCTLWEEKGKAQDQGAKGFRNPNQPA